MADDRGAQHAAIIDDMGIDTTFRGRFRLDRELTPGHAAYLRTFARMRHVQRAVDQLEDRFDPIREAVGLPLGEEGAYFTGSDARGTTRNDPSVIDANQPPEGQPGLWCQWTPSPDGMGLEWDREEKFYAFEEWLHYLVDHFLAPWGYHLSGAVEWESEEERGSLHVLANRIRSRSLPPLGADERRSRILRSVEALEEPPPSPRRMEVLHDLASERSLVQVAEHWDRLVPLLEDEDPAFLQALCDLLHRVLVHLQRVDGDATDRIAGLATVVPPLLRLEASADPELKRSIVALIGPFAMRSTEAAAVLVQTLGSSDRMAAAFAARSLGQHGADAIPLLLGALESDDEGTRCHAAEAFTWVGDAAGPALPFLRARLDSTRSERERRQLGNVLQRLSRAT